MKAMAGGVSAMGSSRKIGDCNSWPSVSLARMRKVSGLAGMGRVAWSVLSWSVVMTVPPAAVLRMASRIGLERVAAKAIDDPCGALMVSAGLIVLAGSRV